MATRPARRPLGDEPIEYPCLGIPVDTVDIGAHTRGMTQTSTSQMTWTEPRRDKYGRPRIELMATVVKDNDTQARWQTCVVVTTLPAVCAPCRYMVTNWMEAPFDADGNRKPEPLRYPSRKSAIAAAEALVAARATK